LALSDNSLSGYQTFEHTADLGLIVRGRDMMDLFAQAAAGMLELMFDTAAVRPERHQELLARGEEPEELLVGWLEEVLYAFEVEGFAAARARVLSLDAGALSGELVGEPFDPARHELRAHLKGVTWHGLAIRRTADCLEVRIVFDV
jgi:SHS2 domain-containing protein